MNYNAYKTRLDEIELEEKRLTEKRDELQKDLDFALKDLKSRASTPTGCFIYELEKLDWTDEDIWWPDQLIADSWDYDQEENKVCDREWHRFLQAKLK